MGKKVKKIFWNHEASSFYIYYVAMHSGSLRKFSRTFGVYNPRVQIGHGHIFGWFAPIES